MKLTPEDQIAIQQLVACYAEAMDEQDYSAWVETWHSAGSWEGSAGKFEGESGLKKLWEVLLPRIQDKRHMMTNSIVTEGSEALTAHHRCSMLIIEKSTGKIVATATYRDQLLKQKGSWKFQKRLMKLDL